MTESISARDEVVDALLDASRALVAVAARSLADVDDVTLSQFRALVLISTRRRTTVSDLAEALGIHPTSATRLCDRLVRKGLVHRLEGVDDRRLTELHLAPSGRHLVQRVTSRRRRDLETIAERMHPGDLDKAIQGLAAFAAAARQSSDEAGLFGWHIASR